VARRLPPLNALRVFEAAARNLSFTRAAQELNVTQAAISHQIKALEEHLGLSLFRRLNRALLLTDEGQSLFPAVRDALDGLAEATGRLRARETGGTLTVSTLPSFAVKWLVPRMSHFQDQHPDIDLRISAKEYLVDFTRDGIDVAVRFGGGEWSGLRADWMADEALTPVCSPAFASRLASLDDLAHVTLLHEDMLPLGLFPTWATWLAAAGVQGIDPTRGPRFSHTHLMLQAAMDGRGVALGQVLIVGDDLAAGRLTAPFDFRLPTGFAYYVVCPVAAAERPKVKAFRDWVMAEMAAAPVGPTAGTVADAAPDAAAPPPDGAASAARQTSSNSRTNTPQTISQLPKMRPVRS
jgi:LysR family transcriptional regulator, glycine cleavage system transcriptional activator